METDPKVCVIIPTYNEAENLPEIVARLLALDLPHLTALIVDDNSPDGTGAIADRMAEVEPTRIRVLHRVAKTGIGPAYVDGFKTSMAMNPDVVFQMDADLSHPPESIPAMLQLLESTDVVVGSRYVDGGGVDAQWSWPRRALSRYGNAYTRLVGGIPVQDASSGFKAFRPEVIEALTLDSLRCKGFGFQAEVTMACQRLGYTVVEHPIHFSDRKKGASKISWGIIWEALWRLPAIRMRSVVTHRATR